MSSSRSARGCVFISVSALLLLPGSGLTGLQNVVATYIGLAVYIACYIGYWLWERFWLKKTQHMVPLMEVDLDTDAVWGPGDGVRIREEEAEEREKRDAADEAQGKRVKVWFRKVGRYLS